MTESASSYRIEHLKSPDNYPTWSVQVKDILSESNLFVYANGTKIKPILAADKRIRLNLMNGTPKMRRHSPLFVLGSRSQ